MTTARLHPRTRSRQGWTIPGVGPEHSYYADEHIAEYVGIDDTVALQAFKKLSEVEGIIPALETAHAVAYTLQLAPQMARDDIIVVNLSGRGDKDVNEAMRVLKMMEDAHGTN